MEYISVPDSNDWKFDEGDFTITMFSMGSLIVIELIKYSFIDIIINRVKKFFKIGWMHIKIVRRV